MNQDWARLGAAIKQARDVRGMTQQELADAAGVSESTVQNLESGRSYRRKPPTLPRIENALGWTFGSSDIVLDGGDPVPLTARPAEEKTAVEQPAAEGRLPLRVQHELRDGEVVDTEVLNLSRGGWKMVVVVTRDRSEPSADDDQLREEFREWSRVQRELRGIVSRPSAEDASSDT